MLKEYLLQNWALILVLLAFVISLRITVFLDKKKEYLFRIPVQFYIERGSYTLGYKKDAHY